jgi:GT2 family glycosyltransferase
MPVYRGHAFVAEALRSIQNQTHREIDVLISVDGGDTASADACAPFLRDSRFRLIMQERRLGWCENASALMAQNKGEYWHIHPQDDLVAPTFIAALLEHARANPAGAVVYCDIEAFGDLSATIVQDSVLGAPALREITLLEAHHSAVAYRGLCRRDALKQSGGLRGNEIENFSADTTWMASVARVGELCRLPATLSYKRYHGNTTHTKWASWPLERRVPAWQVHCRDMFFEAAQADVTLFERRLMWCTALVRLVSQVARGYLPVDSFNDEQRLSMLGGFLDRCAARASNAETLLESPWEDICSWSHRFFARAR